MKIIITESQHKFLISENYDLTPEEMDQVREFARKTVTQRFEDLKKRVRELTKMIENMENIDFSKLTPDVAESVKERLDDLYKENLRDLKHNKKQLEEFDLEDAIEKFVNWDLNSAGGISYKFRYEKYRNDALNRKLTKEDIINLFVTALEGGSNYWYHIEFPDKVNTGEPTSEAVGNFILNGGEVIFYDFEIMKDVQKKLSKGYYNIEGGIVDEKLFAEDKQEALLGYVDMNSILEGISITKEDYPEVWENILLEQYDANDADIFLQLCVMGEIVFG
jgi:Asp-tRNA(Asn)/Glu-tRNA(Gln) amidotransferase C subunit